MNRLLSLLLGPEVVLAVITALVFAFCARHPSGEGRDVELLERLVMLLPLFVVPLVFLTIFVPGARNWIWLTRAVVFTFIGLGLCAGRIISGFGTGAKGQDAAFIIVFVFGLLLVSLGTAISGAIILCQTRPSFAEWFRARRFIGSVLTLLSALPIGVALGIVLTVGGGFLGALVSAFKR